MKHVIVVDEDTTALRPWLLELRQRNIGCEQFTDADDCLQFIVNHPPVDLFVLDVMLPSRGTLTREETDDYLLTGLVLAAHCRSAYPNTPILFFTMTGDGRLLSRIRSASKQLQPAAVVQKGAMSHPGEFADVCEDILASGGTSQRSSIGRALEESVLLQPNIAGVGFDLKRFLKSLRRGS